jgi:NitT/TauT family transport system substrate-binding protein
MGFFDEVGLDVEMLSFDGGIGAMRASKYAVDVAAAGGESLFGAVQGGQQFKAIGTYAPRLSVVMMSSPDVKSPAQLKGRKIGISESGGFNQVMAKLVLDQAGISPDDVQWVSISSADRLTAIVDHRIDGSVLHIEQYYAATRTAPDLNVLARLWEVAPDWWYSAFVAPTEVIDAKHEELVRFMTGVIKAQRFMYTNPVETKRIAVEATKRQPEEVERGYEDLTRGGIWSVNDGMSRTTIEDTIRRQIELGVLTADHPPTYDQVIERSIVEEAIARNGGRWSGDPRWK